MHCLSFFHSSRSNVSSQPVKEKVNFLAYLSKFYRKAKSCETISDVRTCYKLSVEEMAELQERVLDWMQRSSISSDSTSSEDATTTQAASEIASVSVDLTNIPFDAVPACREVSHDQRRYLCKRRRGKYSAAVSSPPTCDDDFGIKQGRSFQDFEEGLKKLATHSSY